MLAPHEEPEASARDEKDGWSLKQAAFPNSKRTLLLDSSDGAATPYFANYAQTHLATQSLFIHRDHPSAAFTHARFEFHR